MSTIIKHKEFPKFKSWTMDLCGRPLTIEVGKVAELASASLEPDVLAKVLGADSLRFLSVDDLKQTCGCQGLCTACFDGSYVTPLYSNKV